MWGTRITPGTGLEGLAEFDDAGFGPEAFVGRAGNEGAVAAVFGSKDGDVAIAGEGGIAESGERDDGTVLCGNDEGGDANGADDAGSGGAVVVIGSAAKAAVFGGDQVVKCANAANFVEAVEGVFIRETFDFPAHALFEAADEVGLVDEVAGLGEGVGAGVEDEGRADGDDTAELVRGVVAHFAGHFEDEIASHGKADGENFGEFIDGEEFFDDGSDVAAKAGIVESRSEFFGPAAVVLGREP